MLTALELYGFKSFAERTRFDFPAGITVVVGPNGSGKSNIVDAIKWVLGEQSAKSLRGKEMADVIFKGTTGTGGRKPANTAEATLLIDNRSRRLRIDSDEVRLTRRVYRSGEGEYLINGEPCRLKDIRNLTRGTGVGVDAYSLIEQGKVDQLLKASPRDRRAMFEEAAGISRFKAKKVEAERRLERVEQNLTRLGDIVEEVGNRYRRIKSQATKASRYKELTTRLQDLRMHVGAKDWRDFSRHLEKFSGEKQSTASQMSSSQIELAKLEEQGKRYDVELSAWSSQILEFQQNINDLIQKITQRQSNIALHQSRVDDLKVQTGTARQSLERENQRAEQSSLAIREVSSSVESTLADCRETEKSLTEITLKIDTTQSQIASQRQQAAERRESQAAVTTFVSELGKELSSSESRLQMSSTSRQRLVESIGKNQQSLSEFTARRQAHDNACQRLQNEAADGDSALASAREQLESVRQELKKQRQSLDDKRRHQTGATQRAEVIQELENRLEGVDSGARDLIERARNGGNACLTEIVGLVADIIKVNVQHAELVDLALGQYTQCLIVDGEHLVAEVVAGRLRPNGRVRLVRLSQPPTFATKFGLDLHDHDGVVGRMDQLVQCEPAWQSFIQQILGGTWLVKTLSDAVRLRSQYPGQARFVTLPGELLETDGTLIAGPGTNAIGLVSRRSELRALHREIHQLTAEIRDLGEHVDQLTSTRDDLDKSVQSLLGKNTGIARQLTDEAAMARSLQSQLDTLNAQQKTVQAEQDEVATQIASLQTVIGKNRKALGEKEAVLAGLVNWLTGFDSRTTTMEQSLTSLQHQQTALKVQFARSQQQQTEAEKNRDSLQVRLNESRETIQGARRDLARMLVSQRSSRREILESMAVLKTLEVDRIDLDKRLQELNGQRSSVDKSRRDVAQSLSKVRDRLRTLTDQAHEIELHERQLTMERQQLAARLKDDYNIDISRLDNHEVDENEDREAIDREITELRTAIGGIGSVNMDALAELDEMQARFELLESQYHDLINSREALDKIIQKINNDSRRLFAETLEAIRANFQVLFRQTFGGGRADLVLEEGVDILEAGIDILATPPGKPEFNNSLLSGGERALTAVSLLMAIFQFRPSPFCVLDEVDAPFDEANVGRFVEVLKSFLTWTKFIIVTHSKRTMTAATTLYGVTMQESGVSKKVSVRFEDVSDDGEIANEARHRDDDGQRTVA